MNLFYKLKKRSQTRSAEQSMITSVFTWAGISLALIFLTGVITWAIINSFGIINQDNSKFAWNYRLSNLGFFGTVLIIASFILRVIWLFRINTVSKQFVYVTFTTYIIGQGVGFGILFSVINTPDLLAIFGVTSLLFIAMSIFGFFAKNLSKLIPFLSVGLLTLLSLILINAILYFSGFYSQPITFLIITLSGILGLLYIAFDVWWIKKTSDIYKYNFLNSEEKFRIVSFLAFRLLTDFIWLFWNIVRMYRFFK